MGLKRKKVQRLVDKWQKILRKRDWEIKIQANEDEDWENFATTGILFGRWEAVMTFWDRLEEEKYNNVVCHEMLHIVLEPIQTLLIADWLDEIPEDKKALFKKQVEDRIEMVVDNLERVFTQELDL
jgi:hypothetical protein